MKDGFLIRKTQIEELDAVMVIYCNARQYMKNNGNPDQWGDTWPERWKIEEDIRKGISYVVIKDNVIEGVFAFTIGEDKTYTEIRQGKWLSDKRYGTIHRLASSGRFGGIFKEVQRYLESITDVNFRIDTHENNKKMISNVLQEGYIYCGHITPIEGGDRLAFEKDRGDTL